MKGQANPLGNPTGPRKRAPHTQAAQQSWDGCCVHKLRDNLADSSQVVHQAAGLPIWCMHRAQETPGLRQQPAHRSRSHLGKVGPSVHAAEMGQVADKVQLVCHNAES